MSWKDLLQSEPETLVVPWTGGRDFQLPGCRYRISGKLPDEHGWHTFQVAPRRTTKGREVSWLSPSEPRTEGLLGAVRGYLVGDRLVPDNAQASNCQISRFPRVHLVEEGLDRFARIRAGRIDDEAPLVYAGIEFPAGPETEVQDAYLEGKSVDGIQGLSPALHLAFKLEVWRRDEAEKQRLEAARKRQEEEERRAREEQRRQIVERLGDAAGRRAMAQVDFGEAAKAALAVGGATYLDHRKAVRAHEMVVKFRHLNRRFECTCDDRTLRIIDAGICLTAHDDDDDDFEGGTKGDSFFTLESLPSVIAQADRERKLVVFRHVD
jgi:hypothetical protein